MRDSLGYRAGTRLHTEIYFPPLFRRFVRALAESPRRCSESSLDGSRLHPSGRKKLLVDGPKAMLSLGNLIFGTVEATIPFPSWSSSKNFGRTQACVERTRSFWLAQSRSGSDQRGLHIMEGSAHRSGDFEPITTMPERKDETIDLNNASR